MPRRANDPELLRAQARGGRQGESIYTNARKQLEAQRRTAVQQAMQEAALRGAPGAAVAELANDVRDPYNQSIRQMTQMGASFEGDMAARQARMRDYNAGIQAARTLIPYETQQAVAPIRAQNRFALAQIRNQGANRVSEIEAQARLTEAQMEAHAQAEQIAARKAAAAKAPTLNQSEMAAALETGAAEALAQAQAQAQQMAQRNAARMQQDPQVQSTLTSAIGAREAARWAYAATTGEQQRQALTPPEPSLFGIPPRQEPSEFVSRQVSQFQQAARPSLFGIPPQQPPSPYVAPRRPEATLDQLIGQFETAAAGHQQAEAPYFSTQTGYLPVRQLGRLANRYGDLTSPLIETAQRNPINDPREIAEIMGGQPNRAGQIMPQATESFRQAMELAATRLGGQGYEFGMPELQLGMAQNRGQTLANYEALQRGEPPIVDQIEAAREQAADIAEQRRREYEDQVAGQRRTEEEAESDYRWGLGETRRQVGEEQQAIDDRYRAELAQVGINWKQGMGPLEQVYGTVFSDPQSGTLNPEFQGALNSVQAWLEENAESQGWDIELALDEAKVFNADMRRLVKAALG